MSHISIVIPVYKAEKCLYELYDRISNSVSTITDDFEIILVEDYGRDRAREFIFNHYTWDKIASDLISIYQQILKN